MRWPHIFIHLGIFNFHLLNQMLHDVGLNEPTLLDVFESKKLLKKLQLDSL